MNRAANSRVGTAAEDISGHRGIDVGVVRAGIALEKRDRGHDLSGLAIAALRNVDLQPGFLHRVAAIVGQPFNGGPFGHIGAGDVLALWFHCGRFCALESSSLRLVRCPSPPRTLRLESPKDYTLTILSPRERCTESEVLDERIEILVAVE
jgi:hypothetical protein